jgi:hypothetical protein
MSEEHVHRSLLARAGWFLAFVLPGAISVLIIVSPVREQGLVTLELPACVVTWIFIGVASAIGFAGCCPRLSWFALMGWLIGQVGALVWDMAPAASPSPIYQLVDTSHALLYAMVIVALLNWPIAPGFIVGRIVKLVREKQSTVGKIPPPTAASATK